MRKAEIIEVARIAAEEVLLKRSSLINEEFDIRFHDVNLLMKNYRKLASHYSNVSPETLEVSSICSMRHKTGLMMSHVQKMIAAYKVLCELSDNPEEARRWEALYLMYINEKKMKVDDIAFKLNIDRRTFYRDLNKAKEDMAVLLFGIEAIGTWKHR